MDEPAVKTPVILITGAGGFTGQHAVRRFSQLGYEVAAVVRTLRTKEEQLPGVSELPCDLTDEAAVRQLVDEVRPDYVLHLAGQNAVGDSWKEPSVSFRTNVAATLYLLNAVRHYPHSRTLVVGSNLSSAALKGQTQPAHPYGFFKAQQSSLALAFGHLFEMNVMVAEPTNLVGPGPSTGVCGLLARYVVRRERGETEQPFTLSSRYEERDYLDVRDAVSAYEKLLVLGKAGTIYPVGSRVTRSLLEIGRTFQEQARVPITFEIGEAKAAAQSKPADTQELLKLGWQPAIPFSQSVADTLDYYRSKGE
ncbi:NAD-dependent epimerase/dehydratase family protein [Paenibacillus turpanensis]|uniref:NAD-dependent epimerase/dehydratase family protein n=1 Tax=Paenibacillus turpanensis TaxID=2689078 RepID=UPI00140CA105|nr:NAD-dependent epimerase/dehydratase family protein [Paenibacillus turpanensis]